jgi:hypothetical protein
MVNTVNAVTVGQTALAVNNSIGASMDNANVIEIQIERSAFFNGFSSMSGESNSDAESECCGEASGYSSHLDVVIGARMYSSGNADGVATESGARECSGEHRLPLALINRGFQIGQACWNDPRFIREMIRGYE